MSDPRRADQPQSDALRTELEGWLNQQNQALLEEVMATWQEAVARFRPDPTLLARLRGAAGPAPVGRAEDHLAAGLDLIEEAATQSDLLRRLLEALTPLAPRSALFVLKQGLTSLYAQRGFEAEPPQAGGAFALPAELEALIQGQAKGITRKGPGYATLLAHLGAREASDFAIFPLRHRRKTVALLLADGGAQPALDHPELVRALVLAASAMLAALTAGRDKDDPSPRPPHPMETETLPGIAVAPAPAPAPTGARPAPDLDPKVRASAERLARVLVGDVELYFPAKVAQARTQGGLYPLLREELDRSRATFIDRFGEEVEARHRIFTSTLVQQLCDGDAAKLGAPPWA